METDLIRRIKNTGDRTEGRSDAIPLATLNAVKDAERLLGFQIPEIFEKCLL